MKVAPTEEWKPVRGFTDLYEVSSAGRVRSTQTGLIRKQAPVSNGYMQVQLSHGGVRKNIRVNRVVCEAFHGPAPTPSHDASHIDGDRLNNGAANLRWATRKENQADRKRHGTHLCGERQPMSRITEAQARDIIDRLRRGESQLSIIRATGLSKGLVNNIALKRSWKYLPR